MTITETTYYRIGIIALLICLGGFIFRGCSHDYESSQTIEQLNKNISDLNKREKEYDLAIKSKTDLVTILHDSIATISKKQEVTDKKLQTSQSAVLSLSQQVKAAKENKDTAAYYSNCDSLSNEVTNLVATQVTNKKETDNIISLYQQSLLSQDSIIQLKTMMYSDLRISFDSTVKSSASLIQTNKKLVKQANRAKNWTRVLAGVAAAFAGYSLLK